jgi:hypothetical protein
MRIAYSVEQRGSGPETGNALGVLKPNSISLSDQRYRACADHEQTGCQLDQRMIQG